MVLRLAAFGDAWRMHDILPRLGSGRSILTQVIRPYLATFYSDILTCCCDILLRQGLHVCCIWSNLFCLAKFWRPLDAVQRRVDGAVKEGGSILPLVKLLRALGGV